MRTRATPPVPPEVTIFSMNPETVAGLEGYLRSAGVPARGRRTLKECSSLTGATTRAIVLFPDDFPLEAVLAALAELATRCRATLRLLVTGQPKNYERLVDGRANVIVMPRPVWGWTILDAIRAHSEPTTGGAKPGGSRQASS